MNSYRPAQIAVSYTHLDVYKRQILDALKAAREAGVTVSVDLNYRKKLWTREKAHRVMSELVEYCDVVIANEEDAEKVFDIKAEGTDTLKGRLSYDGYKEVAKELFLSPYTHLI